MSSLLPPVVTVILFIISRAEAWSVITNQRLSRRVHGRNLPQLRFSQEDLKHVEENTPPATRSNTPEPYATVDYMRALGTSPRRIFVSGLSATSIAFAGNLFGVTSTLLQLFPEDAVEATGLDTYFPRGGFKRCSGNGYSFVYPTEWVADTFVALAKAQRQTKALDYRMARNAVGTTLPDEAFGPPGRLNAKGVSEQGDTNVSVVVSSVMHGFSLKGTLGPPASAAATLLRVSLAPEGSGRTATLLSADEDAAREVYQFEYVVDRGERGPALRAISAIAARDSDTVLTLTVVAPLDDWRNEDFATKLRKVATSFHTVRQS